MITEVYALKKSLEKIAPIGLYAYRLKQYFFDKRKNVHFKLNWQKEDLKILILVQPF